MMYAQTRILSNFEMKRDHPILACSLDVILINHKKRICQLMNFAISADFNGKLMKAKNWANLWTLWNMKMTVIPIVVGGIGTIPMNQDERLGELEIRERTEIIDTTALQKLALLLRRVLEIWRDLLILRFQWNWPVRACVKKLIWS